jgi:hypothetical protein
MKRIISVAILIFASCFAAFAQINKNSCPKIQINAPETVQAGTTFKVSASFEDEPQPSISKFNWLIINENEVSRLNERGIIEVDSKNLREFVTIIILAESLNEKCQIPVMASVASVPNTGSPYIIDEYSELNWNEERARLDNAAFQMQKYKDMKLLLYIYFDKKNSQVQRKNYLVKLLNHLSETKKLEKHRLVFLISETDSKWVRLQPVPQGFLNYYCDDCIAFNAIDFDKFEKLFQPKIIKSRRK